MKTIISFILLSIVAFRPATHSLQQIYIAELGVREATGRNDGSRVEGYLRYVGLKKGDPWCAAFVCYCLGKAGIANPRTGYCPVLFAREKVIWTRGLKVEGVARNTQLATHNPSSNPQPATHNPQSGDVFGIYFPEKGRIAHVGFVDEWGDKYAITVEGNTNEAGSREGDGVYRKRRLISSIYKVARYP
ncbi:CHAP domain-containing protein [Arcticibacter tournemirensis]|uniref:CHAP domain-containing protein n=1 Tax=Arcticibacter tournemirensis TaxID=699437 RepID=A0A5M9HB01_9SPHI|nr:CHAP domain-containing protein [Arcticibacter tournemirensis]KAA8482418.1 CHAP domain-containing protein [Arcticibacter tournemirensis]TQM51697.1 CHAP domain-containing protein [Arcticibacter tournemirensis]